MRFEIWKKIFIVTAVLLGAINVNAQTASYSLIGKMAGLQAPAKAYLFYNNAAGAKIDSAIFQNGEVHFKGLSDEPRQAVIYISKTGNGPSSSEPGYIVFYLENGDVTINFKNTIQDGEVHGGQINSENNQLNIALKTNNDELRRLTASAAGLPPDQKNRQESFNRQRDSLFTVRKSIYATFIKQNPASMMSLFALKSSQSPVANVSEAEQLFDILSADVQDSPAGKRYAAELARMKHVEIGASAPDFAIPDTSGKVISLHDFKGKYVLVDFWASWCAPCRADNPNILKAYATYRNKNFTVISISLDKTKKNWLDAVNQDHLPWTQLSDLKAFNPGGVAQLYVVSGIPQKFLIGPDGKIIQRTLSFADLSERLKTIFSN